MHKGVSNMAKAKNIHKELKVIFNGYKHLTKKINKQLANLGFTVEIGKKHIKIYYTGNSKHYVTISKTASDWRTGLNICTQLNDLILKSA